MEAPSGVEPYYCLGQCRNLLAGCGVPITRIGTDCVRPSIQFIGPSRYGNDPEAACRNAIDHLQLIYQSDTLADNSQKPAGLTWAWPVLLSRPFTDMLMKRKPEALIILCYYAVLLHNRRGIWLVGSAGKVAN